MDQAAFDNVIRELKNTLDKEGNHLDVSSVIASDGVNYFSYYFKDKEAVDIRSIGKPIACMAIGAAIEAGLSFDGTMVGLETPVWPFLSKYAAVRDRKNREKWGRVTLLDCFRITLGHDKGLMFSADVREHDENELVDYVVNYPITREIGKDFVYSNAGTFIVSTLVTEYLGKNLDELVDDYLFTQWVLRTSRGKSTENTALDVPG